MAPNKKYRISFDIPWILHFHTLPSPLGEHSPLYLPNLSTPPTLF